MNRALLILASLALALTGCSTVLPGTLAQTEPSPTGCTRLPLPRIGAPRASFDIPNGWGVIATGPTAGCEVDYVIAPSPNPDDVSIALADRSSAIKAEHPDMTESEAADCYLRGIWKVNDDMVTVRRIGAVTGHLGRLSLYLYHSDYWRYRVASFYTSGSYHYFIEMYSPSAASLQRHRSALEFTVRSLQIP
jgi:hypothetical protein